MPPTSNLQQRALLIKTKDRATLPLLILSDVTAGSVLIEIL
jgi:hypothetical protein